MGLGVLIYLLPHRTIDSGEDGTPLTHRLDFARHYGPRHGRRLTHSLPARGAAALSTSGLQAQLRAMVLLALAAAGSRCAAWTGTCRCHRSACASSSLAFVDRRRRCAIGAAWQAKYHRFAALIPMGRRAGDLRHLRLAVRPDLAVTQLLVEIATTTLLLLGLRWLPKRDRGIPLANATPAARLRRFRDPLIALACGAGMTAMALAVLLTKPGASVGDWFCATPMSRAAAPMSSMSFWSISAPSTPL